MSYSVGPSSSIYSSSSTAIVPYQRSANTNNHMRDRYLGIFLRAFQMYNFVDEYDRRLITAHEVNFPDAQAFKNSLIGYDYEIRAITFSHAIIHESGLISCVNKTYYTYSRVPRVHHERTAARANTVSLVPADATSRLGLGYFDQSHSFGGPEPVRISADYVRPDRLPAYILTSLSDDEVEVGEVELTAQTITNERQEEVIRKIWHDLYQENPNHAFLMELPSFRAKMTQEAERRYHAYVAEYNAKFPPLPSVICCEKVVAEVEVTEEHEVTQNTCTALVPYQRPFSAVEYIIHKKIQALLFEIGNNPEQLAHELRHKYVTECRHANYDRVRIQQLPLWTFLPEFSQKEGNARAHTDLNDYILRPVNFTLPLPRHRIVSTYEPQIEVETEHNMFEIEINLQQAEQSPQQVLKLKQMIEQLREANAHVDWDSVD